MNERLDLAFYRRDALTIAPEILGKTLIRLMDDGTVVSLPVTEVEVYLGTGDKACHASKGMTDRNRVMYGSGGVIYMYLVYGMHWMFNIVTGEAGDPQALLIRGAGTIIGPGRLTRHLRMGGDFYGENLLDSGRIWLADSPLVEDFYTGPRIGINYAGEPWVSIPWRFWTNPH